MSVLLMTISGCGTNDTTTDFVWEYMGEMECTWSLKDKTEKSVVRITQTEWTQDQYMVDLWDETVFVAKYVDNTLQIQEQTLNEDQDFDQVTLSGKIFENNEKELIFEFVHSVDDEWTSECVTTLEQA